MSEKQYLRCGSFEYEKMTVGKLKEILNSFDDDNAVCIISPGDPTVLHPVKWVSKAVGALNFPMNSKYEFIGIPPLEGNPRANLFKDYQEDIALISY